jgi:Family of unknown function (DUF6489)
MKITVNIDCTPDEARTFMGLPDVKPLQEAVLAKLEHQMVAGVDALSPEAMLKSWFSAMPQSAEHLQRIFANFLTPAFSKSDKA